MVAPALKYALFVHEGFGPAIGAFVVARHVGQTGKKGTHYLSMPLNNAQAGMAGRIADRMRAWIERQGSK